MRRVYQARVTCTNCHFQSDLQIPKGVTVKQHLTKNKECPECGIKTLQEIK